MATGLLNGCPIEIEGRKGGSGEGGMLPPGEGKGSDDVCAECGPQSATLRSRWRRMVPGGMEQGRRGPVGWAAAVGQPEETSRFLIYSN
jgi:hypothetical protein